MSAEQQHPGSGPVLAGGAGDDLELDREQWAAVCPREIPPEQWRRFEGYMEEIFTAMGMPAGTVSTAATPRRFLRAIFDATSGYEGDEKLVTAFPTECHGGPDCRISQVVEGPIPFFSLCEHHSLPFFGGSTATRQLDLRSTDFARIGHRDRSRVLQIKQEAEVAHVGTARGARIGIRRVKR